MKRKHAWRPLVVLVAALMLVSACGGQASPVPSQASVATDVPVASAAATQQPSEPTTLNIAAIFSAPADEPWNTAWLQTIERLKAEKPHGLAVNVDYTESVAPPDATRILDSYAKTGKYQIIWSHSIFGDAVKTMKAKYPDITWVQAGTTGDVAVGGNAYWVDVWLHEPAYLAGILAGSMSKSGVLGVVAAYPYPNVNLPVNAFIAGARSIKPGVKVKVTYIESWFDPPKAKEAALAQIAVGADFIYAERLGPFEAAAEKGVYAFGQYVDQNAISPKVVLTSVLAYWDPSAKAAIDAWWDHSTKGTPYQAPAERIMFTMKDGGGDVAPYHGLEGVIPQAARDALEKARTAIKDGTLEVPKIMDKATSD